MFRERWLRPSPVNPVLANSDIEDLGQAFPIVWSPHPLPWPRFEDAEADGHGMCPPQAHTRDTLPTPCPRGRHSPRLRKDSLSLNWSRRSWSWGWVPAAGEGQVACREAQGLSLPA